MNKAIIELLEKNKIIVEEGLDDKEIEEIQLLYGIRFPKSYLNFLQEGVPTSEGFFNWRDKSPDNVNYIREAIAIPFRDLSANAGDVYWNDMWGEEPDTTEKIADYIRNKLTDAPKLIPIYSHRYMPMDVSDNPPILSVYGADVIYYGEDLEDYFQIQFGSKKQEKIDFSKIQNVPFWTELI